MSKCLHIQGNQSLSQHFRVSFHFRTFYYITPFSLALLLTRDFMSRSSDWLLRTKLGTRRVVKLKDKCKGMLRELWTPAQSNS